MLVSGTSGETDFSVAEFIQRQPETDNRQTESKGKLKTTMMMIKLTDVSLRTMSKKMGI